jgi:hypothetical protein
MCADALASPSTPPTRQCGGGCARTLPLTEEFFYFSRTADAFVSQCKRCHAERRRTDRQKARLRRRDGRPAAKMCRTCSKTFPMADFLFPEKRGMREFKDCSECRSLARTTTSESWRRSPYDFCTIVLGMDGNVSASFSLALVVAAEFKYATAWRNLTDDERRGALRHIVAHPTGPVPAVVRAWLDAGAVLPGVTP